MEATSQAVARRAGSRKPALVAFAAMVATRSPSVAGAVLVLGLSACEEAPPQAGSAAPPPPAPTTKVLALEGGRVEVPFAFVPAEVPRPPVVPGVSITAVGVRPPTGSPISHEAVILERRSTSALGIARTAKGVLDAHAADTRQQVMAQGLTIERFDVSTKDDVLKGCVVARPPNSAAKPLRSCWLGLVTTSYEIVTYGSTCLLEQDASCTAILDSLAVDELDRLPLDAKLPAPEPGATREISLTDVKIHVPTTYEAATYEEHAELRRMLGESPGRTVDATLVRNPTGRPMVVVQLYRAATLLPPSERRTVGALLDEQAGLLDEALKRPGVELLRSEVKPRPDGVEHCDTRREKQAGGDFGTVGCGLLYVDEAGHFVDVNARCTAPTEWVDVVCPPILASLKLEPKRAMGRTKKLPARSEPGR